MYEIKQKGDFIISEHDDHRQRVYKRFLNEGLEGFEEHNAMEFLLFLARARGDTNSLAHTLINHFGSVANVLDAPVEELMKVNGIGQSASVVLKFIPQMCAYYLESKSAGNNILNSVDACGEFFKPKFFGKTEEALYMAALDEKRKVLRCVQISDGTANATALNVQKLVTNAVRANATGIILAHNHPGGLALPSSNDVQLTRKVKIALDTINISLVDHLIFCDDDFISFAQTMRLSEFIDN